MVYCQKAFLNHLAKGIGAMGLLSKIAETRFVRAAVEEGVELSDLRQRPTVRTWFGIFFMAFSYVIGWPAIFVLGYVSVHIGKPWLVAVGGPLLYGLSHLVFTLGMVLAGAQYTMHFVKWAARKAGERWGESSNSRGKVALVSGQKDPAAGSLEPGRERRDVCENDGVLLSHVESQEQCSNST